MNEEYFRLTGRKGLIVGIANEHSIAYGCAKAFKTLGADLAITYHNEKAKPYVEPAAQQVDALLILPCDVTQEGQLETVFNTIDEEWGSLDFVVHSIAFAPKEDLQGRLVDSSLHGFKIAMDVSCHSFLRTAKLAEPLMKDGGSLFAMSFYGAEKVVPNYNLMGPIKATLESAIRYVAAELGPKGIRAYAVSPGPIETRAASGLKEFDTLIADAKARAPLRRLASIDDVAAVTAMLATRAGEFLTGQTIYVDGGYHIIA